MYVDYSFLFTHCFKPFKLWNPAPISEYAVLLPKLTFFSVLIFWLASLKIPRCLVWFDCCTCSSPMVYMAFCIPWWPFEYVSTQLLVGWIPYLFLPAQSSINCISICKCVRKARSSATVTWGILIWPISAPVNRLISASINNGLLYPFVVWCGQNSSLASSLPDDNRVWKICFPFYPRGKICIHGTE